VVEVVDPEVVVVVVAFWLRRSTCSLMTSAISPLGARAR
jgi:hypothetical protein